MGLINQLSYLWGTALYDFLDFTFAAQVTSVVCWPASVSATLSSVRAGRVPRPLGAMGDWVPRRFRNGRSGGKW